MWSSRCGQVLLAVTASNRARSIFAIRRNYPIKQAGSRAAIASLHRLNFRLLRVIVLNERRTRSGSSEADPLPPARCFGSLLSSRLALAIRGAADLGHHHRPGLAGENSPDETVARASASWLRAVRQRRQVLRHRCRPLPLRANFSASVCNRRPKPLNRRSKPPSDQPFAPRPSRPIWASWNRGAAKFRPRSRGPSVDVVHAVQYGP